MEEKLQVYRIYLAPSELDYLDGMAREGGFANTSRLIRSLLKEIIRDDKADHDPSTPFDKSSGAQGKAA